MCYYCRRLFECPDRDIVLIVTLTTMRSCAIFCFTGLNALHMQLESLGAKPLARSTFSLASLIQSSPAHPAKLTLCNPFHRVQARPHPPSSKAQWWTSWRIQTMRRQARVVSWPRKETISMAHLLILMLLCCRALLCFCVYTISRMHVRWPPTSVSTLERRAKKEQDRLQETENTGIAWERLTLRSMCLYCRSSAMKRAASLQPSTRFGTSAN